MKKVLLVMLLLGFLTACQNSSIKNTSLINGVYKLVQVKQGKSYYLFSSDRKFKVIRHFKGSDQHAIKELRDEVIKSQWYIAGSMGIQYRVRSGPVSAFVVEPLELDKSKKIKLGKTRYGVVSFIPF